MLRSLMGECPVGTIILALLLSAVVTANQVIELEGSDNKAQIVRVSVSNFNETIKLRCDKLLHFVNLTNTVSSVNEVLWQYKQCGNSGLSLDLCQHVTWRNWEPAHCKNRLCNRDSMLIHNPRVEHSGLYRCLYKNYMSKIFRVSKVFEVQVTDSSVDTIAILPEERQAVTCVEKGFVILRCRAKSLLAPRLCWARRPDVATATSVLQYRNVSYDVLSCEPIHSSRLRIFTLKLKIENCQIHHEGSYFCFALNQNQRAVQETYLSVYSPSSQSNLSTSCVVLIAVLVLSAAFWF